MSPDERNKVTYQINLCRTILVCGFLLLGTLWPVASLAESKEVEPNNTVETASVFTFGKTGNSGEWSGDTKRDDDIFKLESETDTLYDLYVETDEKAAFDVSLLDENGKKRFKSRSDGFYKLTRFQIPAGISYLKISAYLKDKTAYRVYLENPRAPKPGYEYEPNDRKEDGSAFGEDNVLKGRLDSADTDYIVFESDSPLSMWRLDANGRNLNTISYINEAGHKLLFARPASSTVTNITIPDLLLTTGTHYFEIKGKNDYRLSLTKVGDAPAEVLSIEATPDLSKASPELEPNNEPGMALPLRPGQTRRGSIGFINDIDYYRISLQEPARVMLSLRGPAKDHLQANLSWGLHQKTPMEKISLEPEEENQLKGKGVLEKELDQGDYLLEVKSSNFSGEPYELSLNTSPSSRSYQSASEWGDLRGLLNITRVQDDVSAESAPKLIDGSSAGSASAALKIDTPYDIAFAKENPPTIGGVILDTHHERAPGFNLKRFKLEAQNTAGEFVLVLEEEIPPVQGEYAFKFDQPVTVSTLRLTPLEAGYESYKDVYVGEVKPLLSPDAKLLQDIDLLKPELGGHIIYASYFLDAASMLHEDNRTFFLQLPKNYTEKPYWVAGFETLRAPQLEKLTWQELKKDQNKKDLLDKVDVLSSLSSPSGPWTSVGSFQRDDKGEMPDLVFETPLWVRYLKFVADTGGKRRSVLPDKIAAYEEQGSEGYQSILAEWGNGNKASSYELLHPAGNRAQNLQPTVKKNRSLTPGVAEKGIVLRRVAEDHYTLSVPEGMRYLKLSLENPGMLSVEPVLKTKAGEVLSFSLASSVVGDDQIHKQSYETPVSPGSYDLIIREAPLSIAVVWDTSGSVSAFRASIINAVRSVARYAKPNDLMLNLFPFGEPVAKALMPEWSGDPVEIFTTLQHYPWDDGSSNVEGGLLSAVKSLEEQRGTKAVILLTDGESSGAKLNEKTWNVINTVKPRIFVTAIPTGKNAEQSRKLDNYLQSYAHSYNGDFISIGEQADFEKSFEKIRLKLNAPKSYQVQFQVEENLPPPGAIKIKKPEKLDQIALTQDLMVILDASGSMLQRLNGERRIEIAKKAVTSVLSDLPDSVHVGLRTFGESTADLCETRLVQPLEKLNKKNMAQIIKGITPVNGAKTPIAAALLKTKEDFAVPTGDETQIEKLVLLITDGEETCEGDPVAAVKQLKQTGLDVTVNIVGFAVEDNDVRAQLKSLAETERGAYFDAADTGAIQRALEQAVLPAYDVKDANGVSVAQGILGGNATEVPPGLYTVVLHTQPAQYFQEVQVTSGQTIILEVGAGQ